MIDILYLAYNRLKFTEASLLAMLANTAWTRVSKLYLYDDGSTDGTLELLQQFARRPSRIPVEVLQTNFRSPVAVMNHFLTTQRPMPIFAKIDNDVILPPNWLYECLGVMDKHQDLDLLGIEALTPWSRTGPRSIQAAQYIGGIGLMRAKAFTVGKEGKTWSLPTADGRMGFTRWQDENKLVGKAWLSPSLPVVLLNRMPTEPWASLNAEYVAKGWQREWPGPYKPEAYGLWQWWKP